MDLCTSWALWMRRNDCSNKIGWYRTQNVRPDKCGIGSKGFPQICFDALYITPTVLPKELCPTWLNYVLWRIPPSESDGKWLNLCTLVGSQLGRKETAIRALISCNYTNPLSDLAPSLAELGNTANWMFLNRMVKYLDGISDGLGCVSQHQNRSMVVVSSRNPQNSRSQISSSYRNPQNQIITMHNEELGQIPPFILFPI